MSSRNTTESDGRGRLTFTRLRVEIVDGPDRGSSFEPTGEDPISLGAAEDNDLVITDPQASRYHLELTRTPEGVLLQDLGSLNGTWLAGTRLLSAVITPGTRLQIGKSTIAVLDGAASESEEELEVPEIEGMVFRSRAMQSVARTLHRLAPSRVSCLIRGETGTGKEVAARAIHELSPRRDRPFEVVDCGSLPATLIASEFFGHERGAFTGADRQRIGVFERANGGTVMLDEIGELPLAVQPALLGVLERRRFRRLGGDKSIEVDVRIVSATHRDLRRAVNDGTFRADLYYRLAVTRLKIPPLRDRTEDIELLVTRFVREITGETNSQIFGPQTIDALRRHPWTGNVRELRNVVESAIALGSVQLGHTGEHSAQTPLDSPDQDDEAWIADDLLALPYREARGHIIERFEHSYLRPLIERCAGNASKAAREAGMDRNYLVSLLRKHSLRD